MYTNRRLCSCRAISPTSETRPEIRKKKGNLIWAKYRQASGLSTFNSFSMIIGLPTSANSRSPTSALETGRGCCRWKAPLVSRITILCIRYRSSLCNCPYRSASNGRIGGVSSCVAPSTRRIVRKILVIDESIDGEGFGQGYRMSSCIRSGQFAHTETGKPLI